MSPRLTRRNLFRASGFAAAGTLIAGAGSAISATPARAATTYGGWEFVTRPDLHPAAITMSTPANGVDAGYAFLTPAPAPKLGGKVEPEAAVQPGVLIADDAGQPVWFRPMAQGSMPTCLQVQRYQGEPVLTWWQGTPVLPAGYGRGEFVIVDGAYQTVATIRAGNGLDADLHELVITPQDTALLCCYVPIPYDLRPVNGPQNGTLLDNVVQEIEIPTGKVLFEWRSSDHVGITESMARPPGDPQVAFDYFHMNSLSLDGEGKILVSGRNTHAVYQVDRANGKILWRLNGQKSDFTMGQHAAFAWQHDARRLPDGSISVFDNAVGPRSRALVLTVDEQARTANVAREHTSPEGVLSPSQGNTQLTGAGHAFVGWGAEPYYSEFAADGTVLLHASFDKGVGSYRALRCEWAGAPTDLPVAAALLSTDTNKTTVFASWNGATAVVTWRVLAGPAANALRPVHDQPKAGFETLAEVDVNEQFFAVEALDANGAVLATSAAVQRR